VTGTASIARDLVSPRRLAGSVEVPSDKSIAHRALICSALASGEATIELRWVGQDVRSTVSALASLGLPIDLEGDQGRLRVAIRGQGDELGVGRLGGWEVDCANSGTTMRLLAGSLAGGSGRVRLTGDASLSARPMERIAAPLRAMGAGVETTDGHAPLVIDGRRPLLALEHELPMASAQVLGAIALAALAADGRTTIRVPGTTRDHSEQMLRFLGAQIERRDLEAGGGTVTSLAGPASLRARSMTVPGDFSSAAAWIVAGTLHPDAQLELPGVGLNPTRTALLDVLREMGADIEVRPAADGDGGEPVGDLTVRTADRLRAISLDGRRVPALIDELPLLAVAMAAAEGSSEVRGAAELRVKESDRIAAMAAALSAVGADVEELPDGWRIRRGQPRSATVTTHGDHRIAMALAVAAWSGIGASVVLDDPACVGVSYPTFWEDAARLAVTA
jgi:3-phosphoshikimate 1-carboxyvinyltransferase